MTVSITATQKPTQPPRITSVRAGLPGFGTQSGERQNTASNGTESPASQKLRKTAGGSPLAISDPTATPNQIVANTQTPSKTPKKKQAILPKTCTGSTG